MSDIKAQELTRRLEAGERLAVVDIRNTDEYAGWHIAGAASIPVYDALRNGESEPFLQLSRSLPTGRPIVTVCRGGIVSRRAARLLRGLGFDASSLAGGMHEWGGVWTEAAIDLPTARTSTFLQVRRNGKGCLSYLFGSNGEAAVVDPSVAVQAYLDAAARHGLAIAQVLETHVHADHLSRARELCRATGAKLILPPNRRAIFPFTPAPDGATFDVGGIRVEAVATPGHTGESTSYLVSGEVLLTGDTLFVDAVGRPDLERGDEGAAEGARLLYRSLHERILPRADALRVYPAHHAAPIGFDRRPIGATLGEIRGRLEVVGLAEGDFVRRIVASLSQKPGNFEEIIAVNEGRAELGETDPLDLEAGPNCCAAGAQ